MLFRRIKHYFDTVRLNFHSILTPEIKQKIVLFVNGVIFHTYWHPLYINAWVKIRFGKVVPRNWGDDINVFLLNKISGRKIVVLNESSIHKADRHLNFITIGSILGLYENAKSIIWGTGAIEENIHINQPCKVVSVRGPLSRDVLVRNGISCPAVYGDPALLLPRYYRPNRTNMYSLGIIVHITDEDHPVIKEIEENHLTDYHIIKMSNYSSWHEIPDEINKCRCIISSSLHGLILSDAYDIPNMWVKFYGKKKGGEFSFHDYLLSVKKDVSSPQKIEDLNSLLNIQESVLSQYKKIDINIESILNSCPFKQTL